MQKASKYLRMLFENFLDAYFFKNILQYPITFYTWDLWSSKTCFKRLDK